MTRGDSKRIIRMVTKSNRCQRDRSVASAYQTALKKKDDIAIALALSPFARGCQRDRSVASA